MSHLSYFRHDKNCPQKMGSITFMCLLKPIFMQKIGDKLGPNPEKTILETSSWLTESCAWCV